MQVFNYSGPEFNPFGDDVATPPDPVSGVWPAPVATDAIDATLSLPGSKSLTNRELVLSAIAESPSLLRRPLFSRDTDLMMQALRSLGTAIEEVPGSGQYGPDLLVTPGELTGGNQIDCGLAGTVMRFLPPLAALALGPIAFDGDVAARKRPMRTTVDALRALGVDVNDDGRGMLPFSLYGMGRVRGGEIAIDASGSSQFVSGLLLAAPRFETGLTLRHRGDNLPSLAHIEMTIATLARRGVTVDNPEPGVWIVSPGPIRGIQIDIEPDLSNAGPFLAAALVAGGSVTITGWPKDTTQVGAEFIPILRTMGAVVTYRPTDAGGPANTGDTSSTADTTTAEYGDLTVAGTGAVHGITLDNSSELAPTVAALASLADGETVLTGIAHLRGHETDRLAALAREINALGGNVTETADGLIIRPAPLHGGLWHSYEDHRIATAGAIIGLAVPKVEIDDIATTAKTLPQFPELWLSSILGQKTEVRDPFELL